VAGRSREQSDGVKIVAAPGVRKSVWLIAAATALVALAVLVLALVGREPVEVASAPAPSALQPEAVAITAPPPAAHEAPHDSEAEKPVSRVASRRRAASPIEPAPPSHDDVPFSLGKPGVASGIELFPAHGTKPTKIGIVVPDDFELPEGYVRHFQATDDGALLPAVLLFHPDYEWVDDAGNVIEMPPDRVVPPELAPPGLPIQMLELRDEPGAAR
jgi:hypothetical protein